MKAKAHSQQKFSEMVISGSALVKAEKTIGGRSGEVIFITLVVLRFQRAAVCLSSKRAYIQRTQRRFRNVSRSD